MSTLVANLVERLQAKKDGNGWRAKCPAHDDQKPSLSISEGRNGCVLIKCHAGCALEDILAALGLNKRDLFPDSMRLPAAASARARAQKFDWQKCVTTMSEKHVEQVAKWRGYSREFVRELRDMKLIGVYDGLVAFPVANSEKIIGAHIRKKNGTWFYTPSGIKSAPMVFGNLGECDRLNVFESTWDGLAYLDLSGERDGVLVTRGSENTKFVTDIAKENCTMFLWTQNDTAGATWELNIVENAKCAVKRVKIPEQHKDLNDWARSGASVDDLINALVNAETLREPEYAEGVSLMTLAERKVDPENNVLCNRFLCIGGIMFFVGPSGVGKSSVSAQQDISWSLGRQAFHMKPARALRILCIQAENDIDDLTEMASGVANGLNLTREEREIVRANVIYVSDCSHTGMEFLRMLEFYLKKYAPLDLVRIDTLIAYLGGNILDVEITSNFLRNGLNSLLRKYRCAAIVNHHTPKPTNIDRSEWKPSDYMYFGAGNADLTNAPRATMSMDSTHAPDVFEFRAGKRATRIGWADENGEAIFVRYFCWEKGERIFWRDATDDDIARVQKLKPSRGGRSNVSTGTIDDLFNLIPPTGSIEKNVLLQCAAEQSRADKRIGLNRARSFLTQLIDEERAFEWRIKRPKTNPRIEISHHEQTLI